MLIRTGEADSWHGIQQEPDFAIYNAESCLPGRTVKIRAGHGFKDGQWTGIGEQRKMVILGTEYAGEMKRRACSPWQTTWRSGRGILSMH